MFVWRVKRWWGINSCKEGEEVVTVMNYIRGWSWACVSVETNTNTNTHTRTHTHTHTHTQLCAGGESLGGCEESPSQMFLPAGVGLANGWAIGRGGCLHSSQIFWQAASQTSSHWAEKWGSALRTAGGAEGGDVVKFGKNRNIKSQIV